MAQIIPLLGRDATIPLLGGVRGGSLDREISLTISRINDLPTPKSPPKRGISNFAFVKYYKKSPFFYP